jgi:hypothetical protein
MRARPAKRSAGASAAILALALCAGLLCFARVAEAAPASLPPGCLIDIGGAAPTSADLTEIVITSESRLRVGVTCEQVRIPEGATGVLMTDLEPAPIFSENYLWEIVSESGGVSEFPENQTRRLRAGTYQVRVAGTVPSTVQPSAEFGALQDLRRSYNLLVFEIEQGGSVRATDIAISTNAISASHRNAVAMYRELQRFLDDTRAGLSPEVQTQIEAALSAAWHDIEVEGDPGDAIATLGPVRVLYSEINTLESGLAATREYLYAAIAGLVLFLITTGVGFVLAVIAWQRRR